MRGLIVGPKALRNRIEIVDEFLLDDSAIQVIRGMREAASRGLWVASGTSSVAAAPWFWGGVKKRPKLEPNQTTVPVVMPIFKLADERRGIGHRQHPQRRGQQPARP